MRIGSGGRWLAAGSLVALAVTGCGTSRDGADDETGGEAATATATDAAATEKGPEGLFDVGGRELYLSCRGDGEPTVVYLHGYIESPEGGGSGNAGAVPGLLEDEFRFCTYDRANVGRSGAQAGPLSAAGAAEDLHLLLEAAGVRSPHVLLGGSFGGLVAYTYAGTYPDDVAGMVLLDPTLPDEPAFEEQFVPAEYRLTPDAWASATEQMDFVRSYADAAAVADTLPQVPVTLIALETYDLPPTFPSGAEEAIRASQQQVVDAFDPGRLVLVDSPHYMEPVIPQQIADAVREVAAVSP